MNTYIVLLRGVMPSGKNSIKMAFLREILEQADFANVRTYIQSGNVVLQSSLSPTEIAQKVRAVILEKNDSDLPVIVKTPAKIQAVLAENPFGEERSFSRSPMTILTKCVLKNLNSKILAKINSKSPKKRYICTFPLMPLALS